MNGYFRAVTNVIAIILTFILTSGWIKDSNLYGQKLGEVSREELALTSIAEDPEADAVVLFDKGEMVITPQFELSIKRHRRIKILTESGKKYADVTISYWHENVIQKLEAFTILPDGKKIKVDKKNIFEKRNYWLTEKVFAFPSVEVGAILEFRYEKYSEYLTLLEPWYFQDNEFTRLSELSVLLPAGFNYGVFFANPVTGTTEPIYEELLSPGYNMQKVGKFTWRMENLPAIKREPYMTNTSDYLSALHFQLTSYRDPYQNYSYIKTWDDLAEKTRLVYRQRLEEKQQLPALVAELCADIQDDKEKIKKLYNFVRDQIEPGRYTGLFGEELKLPSQVVKDKKGSDAEKNLLLINLLRKAGFTANPVLISTRSHGRFYNHRIQLQQFNHLIACVNLGTNKLFLDTEDRHCPFGLLPPDDLADQGLLISDNKAEIVQIPVPTGINMQHASTQATLTDSGEFLCESVMRFEGYRGVEIRDEITEKGAKDFVKELLEDRFVHVSLDSFEVEYLDQAELPLVISMKYRVQDHAQMSGEMVYVSPALLHSYQRNPFQREKRIFPVDFNYRRSLTEELHIHIPAGLKVVELPKQTNYQSNGIKFIGACDQNANQVRFQRQLMLSRTVFAPHEYPELRNVYERLVSSSQGQLVLTRIQEVADVE